MPLVFYSNLHLNLKTVRSFCSFPSTFIDLNSSSNGSCVLFSLDNIVFRLSGEGCSQKVYFHHLLNRPHWTTLIYLHHSIHWNEIPPKYRYECTKRQSVTPKSTVIFTFTTVISLNIIFYHHSWTQWPPSRFLKIHFYVLYSHLRQGLPSGFFLSGFPTKTMYAPHLSPIRATYQAHRILLNLITRIIFGED